MAEIRQVLQWPQTVLIVQEIRDQDEEPALRIFADELARGVEKIGAARGLQTAEKLFGGLEAVTAAAAYKGLEQFILEGLQDDRVQPDEAHIRQGRS